MKKVDNGVLAIFVFFLFACFVVIMTYVRPSFAVNDCLKNKDMEEWEEYDIRKVTKVGERHYLICLEDYPYNCQKRELYLAESIFEKTKCKE